MKGEIREREGERERERQWEEGTHRDKGREPEREQLLKESKEIVKVWQGENTERERIGINRKYWRRKEGDREKEK